MVLCIIVGCFMKRGKNKDVGFFRVPSVITNEGEKANELSIERRNRWISAISRDDISQKTSSRMSVFVVSTSFQADQQTIGIDTMLTGFLPCTLAKHRTERKTMKLLKRGPKE